MVKKNHRERLKKTSQCFLKTIEVFFLKGVRNGPLKAEIGGFKKWDILNLLLFIAFERLCAELDKRLVFCKKSRPK